MSKMTKSELRDIIETFLPIRRDDDGDYVTILNKDEDFGHDVLVFFVLNEDGDRLQMHSMTDLEVSDERKGLVFCNKWNTEKAYGQAYFLSGTLRMTFTLNAPANVSRDYLKDDFVKLSMAIIWQFYKEAGKEFE